MMLLTILTEVSWWHASEFTIIKESYWTMAVYHMNFYKAWIQSQFRSSGNSYSLWSSDVIQLLVHFPNTTIKWTFHKTSPLATWLSILYFLLSFFLFNINTKYLHNFQKGSKRLYVIFSLFQISLEPGLILLYD